MPEHLSMRTVSLQQPLEENGDSRPERKPSMLQVAASAVVIRFRQLVAEFMGTLFLVFVITFSAQSSPQPISAALLSGLAVSAIVASIAHISGGHVNPAITVGLLVAGEIDVLMAALYVGVQIAGGIVGALCMRGSLNLQTYMSIGGGCNVIDLSRTSTGTAFVSEFVQAFMLMMAVMGAAVDKRSEHKAIAPLAIGFVVANGIGIAGKSSSGGMNPARSFGAATVYSMFLPAANTTNCPSCNDLIDVWGQHYVFWVAPITACILCALLFKLVLNDPREWSWYRSGTDVVRKFSGHPDDNDRHLEDNDRYDNNRIEY